MTTPRTILRMREIAILAVLVSCTTTEPKGPQDPLANITPTTPAKKEIKSYIEEVDQGIERITPSEEGDDSESTQTAEASASPGSNTTEGSTGPEGMPKLKNTEIPMEMNQAVQNWITYFTTKDRERFQRFIDRGERYRKMITEVLKEYQVPEEIYYLAMIESGFATQARSHAAAVGVWQFIRGTGHRYGLRIDAYVDERMDPVKSTEAAARYLRDLYNVYQSWYLAMASYNAGEARILGAIMRANTRDFWQLAAKKALPTETLNYVPKFIAATIIGHHPEHFGFTTPKGSDYPELVAVSIPSRTRLNDVANHLGIPYKELRQYNPALKTSWIPNDKTGTWTIWIPKSAEDSYASKADAIASMPRGAMPKGQAVASSGKHRVKPGETLQLIARRYSVDVADLRRWNKLSSTKIRRGQLLVVEGLDAPAVAVKPRIHVVKRGENLVVISNKYGIPVSVLKKVNRMKHNNLLAGQRLKISDKLPADRKSQRYKVRRGDNLSKIASQFGLTIAQLKKINKMNRNLVYAGQVLKVSESY